MVAENHLIERLPRKDRLSVVAICDTVDLDVSMRLHDAGTRTAHVYFPLSGYVSLLTTVDEVSALGVGMVGREGMVGVHVVLGAEQSPWSAVVHGHGAARRIGVRAFRQEMRRSPSLRRELSRYVVVCLSQLASSAACALVHQIGPRLARWLLMGQDRTQSDQILTTQSLMADILGVRRESVTSAAGLLQKHGLIRYRRGTLTVLDRAGLEGAACSCYASDRRHDGHLPPPSRRLPSLAPLGSFATA